jgi:hypothetical protein
MTSGKIAPHGVNENGKIGEQIGIVFAILGKQPLHGTLRLVKPNFTHPTGPTSITFCFYYLNLLCAVNSQFVPMPLEADLKSPFRHFQSLWPEPDYPHLKLIGLFQLTVTPHSHTFIAWTTIFEQLPENLTLYRPRSTVDIRQKWTSTILTEDSFRPMKPPSP